jgi:hypothetical protein
VIAEEHEGRPRASLFLKSNVPSSARGEWSKRFARREPLSTGASSGPAGSAGAPPGHCVRLSHGSQKAATECD